MAGLLAFTTSGEVALVASTAKSVLQVKAPANQRILIREIAFYGKQPAGGTDTPVKVRMTRSTANFGTFSAATATKNDAGAGETLQATYGTNASVEPTAPTDTGRLWEFSPQNGIIEPFPLEQPIIVPGGQSVQFEMTSVATPTVACTATVEE